MKYLNPEEFKKKMLNLKSIETKDLIIDESIKDESIRFCLILPELFGDDLDRKTLWNRIGSAIETSIIKCNYDIGKFVNLCLEHILADHSKVACNNDLIRFIDNNNLKPEDWKKMFFNYLDTRHFIIIAKARYRWEEKKKLKKGDKNE